ncbi:hypothetical protein BC941DRAFT_455502 [Chlamydoabsidia padenii]|nr:hypothetical protein BC941DRAFT_455502 [Chlamydoabsidia padenii]
MTTHIPTTSSLSSSSSTPSYHHPYYHPNASYPPYQQAFQNTSDPSVYMEEYAPFSYNANHANSNAAMYDPTDTFHLEQFYGQPLDEQQQFFLMQQHQQRLWVEQQQQQMSVPPRSPTAYTTETDSRPQIYVRKACVACKQSHVACDVQRPCSRCVRLNKADSCVDAERKKRGRPCGSGKKKKEEEKEMRRREQQQFHHLHHHHQDPLIR